jgi:hypothetical protein
VIQTPHDQLAHVCNVIDCGCDIFGAGCAASGGCARQVFADIRLRLGIGPANNPTTLGSIWTAIGCQCGKTCEQTSGGCRHETVQKVRAMMDREAAAAVTGTQVRMCGLRNALDVARGRQ